MELTSTQKITLEQFKTNISDVTKPEYDDHYLLKWLRARNWDAQKAEKMFRESQEWRKRNGIDTVFEDYDPPEVLAKYYPGGHYGLTKEGYPIWIEALATADQRGFFYSTTRKELLKFKAYWAEIMFNKICPELSKKQGKKIDKTVEIIDLDGIGLKHLWKPAIDGFAEALAMAEANYPDTLHKAFIINAPSFFPVAYNLVKPFLHEQTRSRIRVFGTNWKEHLLKEISPDQLPKHWGGTATDPDGDPYCRSKVCMGGTIPESYYRMKTFTENIDMSKFTTGSVPRGSSLQLDYTVDVKNSLLSWNFWTDEKDIGFGVFRKDSSQRQKADEMEEVVKSERVNSHVVPEAGRIQCEIPGIYVVRFDNTYSWVNAKKVSYFIEVIPPDEGIELQNSTNF